MVEVWAVTAAVGIYTARRSEKAAKAQSQFEAQMSKEMVPLQGYEERRTLQFQSDLNERNLQKERARKAKAFAGLARQTDPSIPSDYQFQQVEVPDAPLNPVPNDEAYRRVSGLSNPNSGPNPQTGGY